MNYNDELKESKKKTRARIERALKQFEEGKTIQMKKMIALEIARSEILLRGRITNILEDANFGPWEGEIEIHLDIQRIPE